MGNWWLAASSQQCASSCITSRAECFGKTSNYPGDSTPLHPRFGTPWLLAFPKAKITFEREEISDLQWESGKYGADDGDWENCERSQGAYFEGDWGVTIVLCTMFLVSCIFFNKCLYFAYSLAACLLNRPSRYIQMSARILTNSTLLILTIGISSYLFFILFL